MEFIKISLREFSIVIILIAIGMVVISIPTIIDIVFDGYTRVEPVTYTVESGCGEETITYPPNPLREPSLSL